MSRSESRAGIALLALGLACVLAGMAGCAPRPVPPHATTTLAPATPEAPAAPDLSTPVSAVRSYLSWTSYAYRLANANVATPTMTADESVRVDSYIQLNLERHRRIDQHLDRFDARPAIVRGAHAVVGASEHWVYEYVSANGTRTISPVYAASYETTYTLVRARDGASWLVDSVDARALGAVK